MARDAAAVIQRQDHLAGLGDQIGHGQDQARRADHHAVADALGAQDVGRIGVGRHARFQRDDGRQDAVQVERIGLGGRAQPGFDFMALER
jgi:hypothetical protein